jgi:dephospho-CoA kinase
MLKIGVTGNIGSGKSFICRQFSRLGVPVYYADIRARFLMDDEGTIQEVRETFGDDIMEDSGLLIDRKKLAAIVFSDKNKLAKLNSIVHRLVEQDFDRWLEHYQSEPFVLHEAAILFESGFDKKFDKIILVSAPEEIRLKRVLKRDGMPEEEIRKRMAHQWPEEKKAPLCDWIIRNDGAQLILPQIEVVMDDVLKISKFIG